MEAAVPRTTHKVVVDSQPTAFAQLRLCATPNMRKRRPQINLYKEAAMKILAHITVAILVTVFYPTSHGICQTDPYCGFDEEMQIPLTQTGGVRITSFGTVKALLIFIDFPDDSEDPNNQTWPVGEGPNYLAEIVDETEEQNSGLKHNLTTFFRKMSFDQFTMIGKAYYQQTPNDLSWYQTNHPGAEAASEDGISVLE